jgi:hypothetical protein
MLRTSARASIPLLLPSHSLGFTVVFARPIGTLILALLRLHLNSVWSSGLGRSRLPGAVVPLLTSLVGFNPTVPGRYFCFVGMYGQVITE